MGKAKKAGGAKTKAKAAKSEKKVKKVVEDKTFGLKNKNKSKKVQKYIEQINSSARNGGGKQSRAFHEQQAARKKAEKEAKKQAELEMFKLLGDAYKPKNKNKSKRTRKKEEEEQQKKKDDEEQRKKEQYEKDFSVPIISLIDVFQMDSRTVVERVCAVLEHKDNLVSKTSTGSDCLYVKISDGSTRNPFTLTVIDQNPTSFIYKVGDVLDIRSAVAMVRGEKVYLETEKDKTTLTLTSESLKTHVLELKQNKEEIRAQGGIAIEQLIEEQRAKLDSSNLTPVNKERFFKWKEEKRKKQEIETLEKQKKAEKKSGKSVKNLNILTGRQLFVVDKSLFKDDENAWVENNTKPEETDENPGLTVDETNENLFLDDVDDFED